MITRRSFLKGAGKGAALTLAAGATAVTYGVVIEPWFRLVVREWTVTPASWTPGAPPLRIAILSDIHAVKPWMSAHRIAHIADAAMELKPDVIALLGDYMCGLPPRLRTGRVPLKDWTHALGRLRAPLGVYAVLGNHDWDEGRNVQRGLASAGLPVLENQAVKIEREGHNFWIAGLIDQETPHGPDDVGETLRQVTDKAPVIMLAHEPDTFAHMPSRVALTLSGHNHGGQVWLPGLGAPWLNSRHGQQYLYGHVVEDGRHLVVSGGLGLTGAPIRFMVPPEITVVNLRPPAGAIADNSVAG
jgi:uncharacterized protein